MRNISNIRAENLAKRKGFICAMTLGAISPKSRSTKVTTTVLTTKSNRPSEKIVSMMLEVTITMQMLTKLLITNIVASNRSMLLSSSNVVDAAELFSPLSFLISLWFNEKNAVSEPDTVAESSNSRSATTARSMMFELEKEFIVISSRISTRVILN